MNRLIELLGCGRMAPSIALVAVILASAWMGNAGAGYFVGGWSPVALLLAALALLASLAGLSPGTNYRAGLLTLGLFAAYTAWTFASLLWSPNKGDAWLGAGQTLLYLLAFWVSMVLLTQGASRRWALAASVIGPALLAALTLPALSPRLGELFEGNRLVGTAGYYNGEAAFLLVPFWAAVYLAGSRDVNPLLRSVVLAGAVLSLELAVLTQSRGAMVSMAVSLPVFFLLSGQRLRGLLVLAPIAAALLLAFPRLNGIYLAFLNEESAATAIEQALPTVWLLAGVAGLYGLLWGLIDKRWRPPRIATRAIGGVTLLLVAIVFVTGTVMAVQRVGNPVAWGEQKWETFKANDISGQEQSRYLSTSGSGRYTVWQVAWEDFVSHPLLGVGTHNYEATYYQQREQYAGSVRQPHMLPLEVLAERGIVGGIFFFGFLALCLAAGLWRRFRDLNSESKAQIGAMIAAVTYWFVHSSAEWFWQMPAVTLPAIVYLAMLAAPWRNRDDVAPLRWPLRTLGAGVAVLAIAAIAPLYVADRYLQRSYAVANPQEALRSVEQAHVFNPLNPRLREREAELAIEVGDWERVEKAYREAIRLNPEHYAPYMYLATFYERRGELEKAAQLYREASERNPLDAELDQRAARLAG